MGILPSGYNGLRNLKEEIARIFLLKYRNPQLEQGSMYSTRRSGAAWLGGKAEQYHSRAAWKPQEPAKGGRNRSSEEMLLAKSTPSKKAGDIQKKHGEGGNKERPEQGQAVSRAAMSARCQI